MYNALYALVTTVVIAGIAWEILSWSEQKRFPTNKVCPRCPKDKRVRHNYLTPGGICQECAWKEIDGEQ